MVFISSVRRTAAFLSLLTLPLLLLAQQPDLVSTQRLVEETALGDAAAAELAVDVVDSQRGTHLPVRVVVTGSDGKHADGSGCGVYADGRFFADGKFTVKLPPGAAKIVLRSGPNYVPLEFAVEAKAGRRLRHEAKLLRWFSPEQVGWYSGDNHVHAQHDAQATIKTSLAYTALQARANGVNFITEAGSEIAYDDKDKLDTPTFLFRHAQEIRPGPFVGHLNTPGIKAAIPQERLDAATKRPLPAQGVVELVHGLGGAVIHTHPLTPPHQLHWMGAGELWCDAVLGRGADALDLDSRHTEQLWFAALNLGSRIAASGSTDCALGRPQTPSPGDRRVYVHAPEFTYPAVVQALRQGKTFATNGGPLFPFFTLDGQEPGGVIEKATDGKVKAVLTIHSLHPLRAVQLYRRGKVVHSFDLAGKKGEQRAVLVIDQPDDGPSWYVVRAEDEKGNWAITSPVYVGRSEPKAASAVVFGIGNYTRFIQLRREFFAHLLVTTSPDDSLQEVELLKDGKALQVFKPDMGNQISASKKVPVTEINGDYAAGWIWHAPRGHAVHLQADWPVTETGWYAVRAKTAKGRTLASEALHFDAKAPNSRTLSAARLRGADTALDLWGYGEEMPLADVVVPFVGDHWWYPKQTFWSLRSNLAGQPHQLGGGNKDYEKLFRANDGR